MVTGIERLTALVNGTIIDRVPVFCNLIDQGAKQLGLSIQEYFSNGEYVAEAQLKMREKYGYDSLWSLFYAGREAELLGCNKMIFPKNGPPNVGHMIIKNYDDIHKLQIPEDITTHPAFEQPLKCLKILKKEAGGKYPICAYTTSSMTLPAMLMGMEKWMELLLFGPTDIRDELLEKCSDFFAKHLLAYKNAGADIFVYANPFGSTDFVSLKQFNELSMPWMKRDIQQVGINGVVYYCGSSRMNNVIDLVIKHLNLKTFYLSPMDNIAEAKRIIAGRAIAAGVINDIELIRWTKDEIKTEVKRIFDAGMPSGKFFFGTLVMPYEIPEENIKYMLDVVYDYGKK
ncbi:MAG: uroporphyrinogen decarboxylase [Bacteroidetes bacterium RIFOXYB2_FULL_35_7]|nr:MAG: uroporphyrinogen decarboxylase [Bacteroidetes bacterium GWF2_35_48]OFY92995.1 MAG: uroporphyrinogen decarboxylase [Bacteroidetes bacterium RIFOXYC12_FULL_35_7]OFY94388.1 MAG: uroporphyrinogen decarboxylase [Bacteroidetes bacterium RIFOXYB2_FULL_35_7]HBX51608.1 uroporphyrinogen decarboxylase [Bacteroidales bacterium]